MSGIHSIFSLFPTFFYSPININTYDRIQSNREKPQDGYLHPHLNIPAFYISPSFSSVCSKVYTSYFCFGSDDFKLLEDNLKAMGYTGTFSILLCPVLS